jgi:hypothetical protein
MFPAAEHGERKQLRLAPFPRSCLFLALSLSELLSTTDGNQVRFPQMGTIVVSLDVQVQICGDHCAFQTQQLGYSGALTNKYEYSVELVFIDSSAIGHLWFLT